MKITLNWLRDHVAYDGTPGDLEGQLTLLGIEVEGVTSHAGAFDQVVVGEVIEREKHPNADRLSWCRVHDGKGERRIVCGAQNFKAGDKVPLALPGAVMPTAPGEKPWVIQVGKIRGVESQGMLCSARELGLGTDGEGLWILPPDAPVGQPLAGFLNRPGGDVVLDLETTPNRPDWNSVVGIAREVAALTGAGLKVPEGRWKPGDEAASGGVTGGVADLVEVRIEAPELCRRYTARVIRGVQVGPSPAWMRERLERVGLRSINNVVDVTNYVLIELGHPLHAFDLAKLGRGADGRTLVRVRRADPGEAFETLDGGRHTLDPDALVIADAGRAVALAGIMGGRLSGVGDDTVDLLLESAWFDPACIRRTSRRLGLRSDASYRYERGADIGICEAASRRAVALLLELAGGRVVSGVVDAHPGPLDPRTITLRPDRLNALLGTRLQPDAMAAHLGALGLERLDRQARPVDAAPDPGEPMRWRVPSWRVDLKEEVDLIEEVARLHGVDKLEATPPRGGVGSHPFDAVHDDFSALRGLLAGLGLDETQGQTLIHADDARLALDGGEGAVRLEHPLSSDMSVLRPSLLPGLLAVLRHNTNRQNPNLALFELGRVFRRDGEHIVEGWRLGLALAGQRAPTFWAGDDREARVDMFDLKGVIEELLDAWAIGGVTFNPRPPAAMPDGLFLESAAITLGGGRLAGVLGRLSPLTGRHWDLREPVFLAELDLDLLRSRRQPVRTMKPLSTHPAVRRDLAWVLPESVSHAAVLGLVRRLKVPILERVELFDVYRGAHVPAGKKSLAYAFQFRAADRTLRDEEVQAALDRLVAALEKDLGAQLRAS